MYYYEEHVAVMTSQTTYYYRPVPMKRMQEDLASQNRLYIQSTISQVRNNYILRWSFQTNSVEYISLP